jgi:enamine deaminase RidA (YjgF/YER057c/UK114 family)
MNELCRSLSAPARLSLPKLAGFIIASLLLIPSALPQQPDSKDAKDTAGPKPEPVHTTLTVVEQVETEAPAFITVLDESEVRQQPGINIDDGGLERYRRFNLHRFKAYDEAKHPTATGAPAACALGSSGGPLVLYCLASKTPPEAIENPRQTSAYRYPQQYGPRAPSFSRAALWRGDDEDSDVLFVSGTASIVGHETLHQGNVVAQAHETLTNLQSVVASAVSHGARDVALLSDLRLKAYVRHPQDQPRVQQVLAGHGLDAENVLYLHADICRSDLLVEIEAIGPARSLQIRTETTDTQDSRFRSSSDIQALPENG